ncbi:MAG TPA: hypothetical protein VMG82_15885 [Candidatus Sulfotelmatobacter sp.]|nr:hypothetical protein [Candidatus Sulfotelmatobacter sp.]
MDERAELRHLRPEVRTALELAIVALAPASLVDQLAVVAGLLEALETLPSGSARVATFAVDLTRRAHQSLAAWGEWRDKRTGQG